MAHRRKVSMPKVSKPNIPAGATTTSNVSNVSNTGQMSTSTSVQGTKGQAVSNTNVYTSQGAPGAPGQTVVVSSPPGTQVGETPGEWNWMDDIITNAYKNLPR